MSQASRARTARGRKNRLMTVSCSWKAEYQSNHARRQTGEVQHEFLPRKVKGNLVGGIVMKNPKEKSQVEDSAWRLKQQLPLLPNDFHSLIG